MFIPPVHPSPEPWAFSLRPLEPKKHDFGVLPGHACSSPPAEADIVIPRECKQEAYERDKTHCLLLLLTLTKNPSHGDTGGHRWRRERWLLSHIWLYDLGLRPSLSFSFLTFKLWFMLTKAP
jgi:hypothetical protein